MAPRCGVFANAPQTHLGARAGPKSTSAAAGHAGGDATFVQKNQSTRVDLAHLLTPERAPERDGGDILLGAEDQLFFKPSPISRNTLQSRPILAFNPNFAAQPRLQLLQGQIRLLLDPLGKLPPYFFAELAAGTARPRGRPRPTAAAVKRRRHLPGPAHADVEPLGQHRQASASLLMRLDQFLTQIIRVSFRHHLGVKVSPVPFIL